MPREKKQDETVKAAYTTTNITAFLQGLKPSEQAQFAVLRIVAAAASEDKEVSEGLLQGDQRRRSIPFAVALGRMS